MFFFCVHRKAVKCSGFGKFSYYIDHIPEKKSFFRRIEYTLEETCADQLNYPLNKANKKFPTTCSEGCWRTLDCPNTRPSQFIATEVPFDVNTDSLVGKTVLEITKAISSNSYYLPL